MKRKNINIDEQLKRAIIDSEMSCYRLSKVTNVDQAVLSNFMNGKRTITLTTAGKLALALGLRLERIEKKGK